MKEIYRTENSTVPYRIIRSKRRTMGIEVGLDGTVVARIPNRTAISEAQEFVEEKQEWILKSRERMKDLREKKETMAWEDIRTEMGFWMKGKGGEMFREKVDRWAEIMDVDYRNLRIKDTRTRWGSCSNKKNINFCWKIFAMPEKIVDYLIVHELAHIKQMNHSSAFWAVVEQYIPDYRKRKKELNGYT